MRSFASSQLCDPVKVILVPASTFCMLCADGSLITTSGAGASVRVQAPR